MAQRLQFLDPEKKLASADEARVVVLPIPLEKTTSYLRGTAGGPEAIVQASSQVEYYDPELGLEPCQAGIYTDWEFGDPAWNNRPVEEILDRIRSKTRALLDAKKFVLGLGGEHTITVGLIDPYIERYGKELTVVQIDAHADLRNEYQGTPYSHASAMRRLLGRVPIVSIGIRSLDSEEAKVGKPPACHLFYAHEIRKNPKWIPDVLKAIKSPKVYLTVDVDGLDPSVLGSTGTPVPGGLGWYETLDLFRAVAEKHEIVGADVNEFTPGLIPYCDYTAALLCYKIIGYAICLR
ncbi:MAG TPA: agmatinase [Bdellovibrionota bacterium]|nr:agmatinase [Bdellovibrionota bacterium]